MMEEKRFLDFLDMFDGGGAGQMGDKFEGGGLYSMIGNAFGSPYGSEDPERMAARQAFYGSDQIGGAPMTSAPPPQVMPPQVMPQQTNYATEPNYADRFGVPMPVDGMQAGPPARALVGPQLSTAMNQNGGYTAPQLQYSGRGSVGMPRPDAMASIQEIEAYLRSIGHPDYQ